MLGSRKFRPGGGGGGGGGGVQVNLTKNFVCFSSPHLILLKSNG